MSISLQCTECDKKLKVADTAAGKKIRCPACKAVLTVPEPVEIEPEEDVAEEIGVTEKPRKKTARKRDEDEIDDRDDRDDDDDDERDRRPRRRRKRRRDEDDDDFDDDRIKVRRRKEGHRAIIIMILACAAIFFSCIPLLCWILAAFAENMARTDLKKMDAGDMDRSGRGLTQAGQIIAYVAAVLGLFACALNGYFFSFQRGRP